MTAIFHLFDIQNHHFPFRQPSINIPQDSNFVLKGTEAPRNSLELQEPAMEAASSSSSSKLKEESNLKLPISGIQIKTKRSRLMDDLSSECSSSPGSKTPNLVARLMGLDLLPENSSPRPSSSSMATPLNPISKLCSHTHQCRSLPATPRTSAAGRRSTEDEYHHRLSLQINKENCNKTACRRSENMVDREEYAKQIAKQVRESISRRVAGADITNTINVKNREQRRDVNLVLLKSKPPPPPSATVKQDESTPENRFNKPNSNSPSSSSSTEVIKIQSSSSMSKKVKPPHQVPLAKQEVQVVQEEKAVNWEKDEGVKVKKCKKIASERYDLRVMKQEEAFVKRKCKQKKSTPLSNHLLNVNATTKFHSFKKDIASPPTTPTLPQKQVSLESITQLTSCQSQSYNSKKTQKLPVPDYVTTEHNYPAAAAAAGGSRGSVSDHHAYISRILSLSGIDQNTPISITHWYSPSHPLHPSIFLQLEKLFNPTTATAATTAAASRKLIFELVDEILVEILKPYISFKPWVAAIGGLMRKDSCRMSGSELIGKLCERIGSFPAADCRVLEDIDGLIAGDMGRSTRRIGAMAFEEEAEELATEIERDIVDTLVHEMAMMTWHIRIHVGEKESRV